MAAAVDGRWTHLGPFGGPVADIVVAPSAHRTLYAAADPGVYRSDDAGGHWRLVAAGLLPGVSTVAVDPSDARIVYAGRGNVFVGGATSLFKTVDGGATWAPLSGAAGETISDIAVDPHDPSRILAAGYVHLFRSEDGGATWESLDLQTGTVAPLFQNVAFDPMLPGVAYAASGNEGFLKSVDGGATWTQVEGAPGSLSRMAVSPSGVLVAVPTVQVPSRVFRSLDHGETWTVLGPIPDAVVYDFAFSPDGTLLAGTSVGVFRKKATGAAWTRLRPDQREEVRTIAADPVVAGTFYAGLGFYGGFRGVLKTRDFGATWRPANQGLGGLFVYSAAIAPSDPDVIYASSGILTKSTDGGATWRQIDSGFESSIFGLVVDPRNADVVSGVGEYGLFVRSTNGGRTWTHEQIEDGECVFPFFLSLDPRHPDDLFVSGSRETACARQDEDSCHTLATSDGGESWECLEGARSSSFSNIVVDPRRRSSTLYGAALDGVFKSTDGGQTWVLSSNGIPERGVTAALVIAPNGTLWAGTGAGLFKSADGARTWRRTGRGLPRNRAISKLALAPSDPKVLYAEVQTFHPEGSTYSLYVSTDRGATWRPLPEAGLPAPGFSGYSVLLVDPRDPGRLYAGTPLGLYRLDGALD